MKKCPRCNRWHHGIDSETCERCWEDIGQMQFWQDLEDVDEDEVRLIDTVFDREEEARGYQ
jgi:hypothetical protein